MDGGALLVREVGGRRLLHDFLEAALQRAVAGADDDDVTVGIGKHLRLHVAGLIQVALDEALAAAESRDGFAGGRVVQVGDLVVAVGDLHAASAAAESSLDGDGQAVLGGEGLDLRRIGDGVFGAGGHRGIGTLGNVARGDLVAQIRDGLRRRANPDKARFDHRGGEVRVFGQEAVTGVDGVRAGLLGGI